MALMIRFLHILTQALLGPSTHSLQNALCRIIYFVQTISRMVGVVCWINVLSNDCRWFACRITSLFIPSPYPEYWGARQNAYCLSGELRLSGTNWNDWISNPSACPRSSWYCGFEYQTRNDDRRDWRDSSQWDHPAKCISIAAWVSELSQVYVHVCACLGSLLILQQIAGLRTKSSVMAYQTRGNCVRVISSTLVCISWERCPDLMRLQMCHVIIKVPLVHDTSCSDVLNY